MEAKSCLYCMLEDFEAPLISLDGPHYASEVYFGPDYTSKTFFFLVVAQTDAGLTPHIKMVVSAACLTQDTADFISGTSSHGSTDPQRHFSTKAHFSSVYLGGKLW